MRLLDSPRRKTDEFCRAVLFFAILQMSAALFALNKNIAVYVEDSELEMPLEGAVIHIEGRDYLTDENGRVSFAVNAPNAKSVLAIISYPGYEPARLIIRDDAAREYKISLRMEAALSNKELVFSAERVESGTQVETGRGVTIREKELARTSEIGFLEDVMTSVKLLPGVGYTGMFGGMPSIRGGDPGDLIAALDGFYIENPYFWEGGVSIFDPRMIESVKLSHGVFSARYGRTISGLLELESKKPSSAFAEIELGVSTSSANLNVSFPVNGKGGFMIMGKATYWDAYIGLLKALSNSVSELEDINSVATAPYIRMALVSFDYNFSQDLRFDVTGFFGADGIGAYYQNDIEVRGRVNNIDAGFLWDNMKGFVINSLRYNPRPSMALNFRLGGGFDFSKINARMYNYFDIEYNKDFMENMESLGYQFKNNYFTMTQDAAFINDSTTANAQGRVDYDWELPRGFLFSAGLEELYSHWPRKQHGNIYADTKVSAAVLEQLSGISGVGDGYINIPFNFDLRGENNALSSAAYSLLEYKSPSARLSSELGLRIDHLYFIGEDFTIQSYPAFNPRFNIGYDVLKNKNFIDILHITLGTGLFSSLTDAIQNITGKNGIEDYELKQNRSWTSVAGLKIDFLEKYSFNIEAYYKYVFDRAYQLIQRDTVSETGELAYDYHFDGIGHIGGFDLMLQKFGGGFFSGWISYTFTYARYYNPYRNNSAGDIVEGYWHYPLFHRFHNLNIVFNIRPFKRFNISGRLGFASGIPKTVPGEITSYPVWVVRPGGAGFFAQKYKRTNYYSDTERDGFALPLDLKFSFYSFLRGGKTQCEVYLAVENVLFFVKTKKGASSFDQWTGQEVSGSDAASYDLPIPMVSFGFTWTY